MDTNTLIIMLAVILFVIASLLLVFVFIKRKRTKHLQEEFGPEYDHIVDELGDQRQAEKNLEERRKRVESLQLRTLTTEENQRFHQDWFRTQSKFVDNPSGSLEEAHELITEVLLTRGYPNGDFDDRVADISVDYPELASNYRSARAIRMRDQQYGVTTDELRVALTQYRSLFEELIKPGENGS